MTNLFDRKISQAVDILKRYGSEYPKPFAMFFSQEARQNKAWGSKDRKVLKALCFATFRLARYQEKLPWEQRVRMAISLIDVEELPARYREDAQTIKDENGEIPLTLEHTPFGAPELTETPEVKWFQSPRKTWLRLRTQPEAVKQRLTKHDVSFETVDNIPDALGIDAGVSLDQLLGKELMKGVQIQDISSQIMATVLPELKARPKLWDACSGSGGKTLLLNDRYPNAKLFASDVRESASRAFTARMRTAGLSRVSHEILDLSKGQLPEQTGFDLVLVDAPCTGSATWARNPEHLSFFDEGAIKRYATLQESLVKAARNRVADGGYLVYATCSLFLEENERVVQRLENEQWTLVSQQLINALPQGGDGLFVAVWQRNEE